MPNTKRGGYPRVTCSRIGYRAFNPSYKDASVRVHKAVVELCMIGAPTSLY